MKLFTPNKEHLQVTQVTSNGFSDFWSGKFPTPLQSQPRLSPAAVAQSSTSEKAPEDEKPLDILRNLKGSLLEKETIYNITFLQSTDS